MRIAVIGLGWVATAVWLPRLLARAKNRAGGAP